MLSLLNYITETFIKIDGHSNSILKEYVNPLRARGFKSKLSDSELFTIKIIDELCSIDSTVGIWIYTKKHWSDLFRFPQSVCQTVSKPLGC
ncbi:hypothetical protein SAMN02583745_02737 [Thorsellia anophelis DSM 18579]|uniref:Uncharacterized protein n=1 Tax=Thorsellia anophelis DSM 18579 TaxID=1123402 RepID=A0A1I0FET1_9GAMM|nr:hypothetical protein [Thorsellia anophelis]SET56519.1 hypothetical protein SAMN02583745_02737 [Thorsellia anophelis DSM 18579]